MEVYEKYPDSRRLDHPSVADVRKTTFAKGVITDFEKIQDDPIQVKSRVKVTGDFGESDYIPLFFKPKSQYWDGEDALATDFDEELGCFKQAWMSFQSGDEVAVMLKEGKPVAVIGFADGIPRIGENVFKMTWERWNGASYFAHIQAASVASNAWSEYGTMNEIAKGPDGIDLGLVEAYKLCETSQDEYFTISHATYWMETTQYFKYHEYLIRLGGKVFIIQLSTSWIYSAYFYQGYDGENYIKGGLYEENWYYGGFGWGILGAPDSKDLIESAKSLGGIYSGYSAHLISIGTYADEDFNYYLPYPGFTHQSACVAGFMGADFYPYLNNLGSGLDRLDGTTIKIYTRPHTKAELQEVGMWPKEEGE